MTQSSDIKLICFDLGGVVVRICRTWAEACAFAGIEDRDPDRFADPEMRARRHSLVRKYQSGHISCKEFFEGIAAASAGLYTAQEIERIHRSWTREDYPGVERLIRELHRAGNLQTACLSNTNHMHWQILRSGEGHMPGSSRAVAKLRHHFVSHKLGAVKPEEQAYRPVERALALRPQQIVFFDDTVENIDAARAFGWHAHLVDHAGDTAEQMRSVLKQMQIEY